MAKRSKLNEFFKEIEEISDLEILRRTSDHKKYSRDDLNSSSELANNSSRKSNFLLGIIFLLLEIIFFRLEKINSSKKYKICSGNIFF